jgi:hypothetical protein
VSHISPTSFWASIAITASALGGLLTMQVSHRSENGHSSLAEQSEVSDLRVELGKVSTEVKHNRELLNDLKIDIRHIKQEQDSFNQEVLEVIRGN